MRMFSGVQERGGGEDREERMRGVNDDGRK